MSVSSTGTRIEYVGNGVTTAFAFPYPFHDSSHLVVLFRDLLDNDITKTLGADYSVTGAGSPSGGTVTFVTAPTSLYRVCIYRDTAKTQQVDYVAQDNFPAETHETALDRLTVQNQDTNRRVDRALRIPDSNPDSATPSMALNNRRQRVVGFDQAGNLDLTVNLDNIRTIIIANPVAGLTSVTDYGDLTDPVAAVADYGTIA